VQKLACEAVQDIRIKHRWKILDAENKACKKQKELNTFLKFWLMVIPENNYWPEADISYLSLKNVGHSLNGIELRYVHCKH
jgi:hypothetical protein